LREFTMPLSFAHIDTNPHPVPLDIPALASKLERLLPEALFGLLIGSTATMGVVRAYGDLDLAFFLSPGITAGYDFQARIEQAVEPQTQGRVRVDVGLLNRADPVYRFEALKGRLLFCRDDEAYMSFFSSVSRDYETQMIHYARQRMYRLSRRPECR
jgi:hypothetical protein